MNFVLGHSHSCTVPESVEGRHHDGHVHAKADLLLVRWEPSFSLVLCVTLLLM